MARPGPAEPCVCAAESDGSPSTALSRASCHLLILKATCSDSRRRIISKVLHQQVPDIPGSFLQESGTIWRFLPQKIYSCRIGPWCDLAYPASWFLPHLQGASTSSSTPGPNPSYPLDSDLGLNLSGEFWTHLWLASGFLWWILWGYRSHWSLWDVWLLGCVKTEKGHREKPDEIWIKSVDYLIALYQC